MTAARKIRAAVVGASGYAGSELTRFLLAHPAVELTHLYVSAASSDAGRAIAEIDGRLFGRTQLVLEPMTDPAAAAQGLDAVFLATEHIVSAALAPIFAAQGAVVFDLSGAYRLPNASDYPKFYGFEHKHPELLDRAVYALGEFVDRGKLRAARIVSLPGCYPTASQLALKPLIDAGLLAADFKPVIDAVSGVSGAGRKAKIGNVFCEVSLSAYGVFTHRHRPEIEAHLGRPVIFTPHLGPFKRGILATITVKLAPGLGDQSQAREKIQQAYESAYAACPLVRLRPALPKLDDVVNLPFCDIGFSVDEEAGYAVVVSAIDNLIKGAAGQAVQVMNLRFGFPETKGLL